MSADEAARVLDIIDQCVDADGWTNLANMGAPLKHAGVDYKSSGLSLVAYLEAFPELELETRTIDGRFGGHFVRRRGAGGFSAAGTATAATTTSTSTTAAPSAVNTPTTAESTFEVVKRLITQLADDEGWANLADMGAPLKTAGVDYKKEAASLYAFLSGFDGLDLQTRSIEGRFGGQYVRIVGTGTGQAKAPVPQLKMRPDKFMRLWDWANVPKNQYNRLAEMALEERWY